MALGKSSSIFRPSSMVRRGRGDLRGRRNDAPGVRALRERPEGQSRVTRMRPGSRPARRSAGGRRDEAAGAARTDLASLEVRALSTWASAPQLRFSVPAPTPPPCPSPEFPAGRTPPSLCCSGPRGRPRGHRAPGWDGRRACCPPSRPGGAPGASSSTARARPPRAPLTCPGRQGSASGRTRGAGRPASAGRGRNVCGSRGVAAGRSRAGPARSWLHFKSTFRNAARAGAGSLPYLTRERARGPERDEAAARAAQAPGAAGRGRPAPARPGRSPLLRAPAGPGRGRGRRPSRDVLPARPLLAGSEWRALLGGGERRRRPRVLGASRALSAGRGGSSSARAAAACAAEGGVGSAGRGLERGPRRGRRAPGPSRLRGHRRARPSAAVTSWACQVYSLHV